MRHILITTVALLTTVQTAAFQGPTYAEPGTLRRAVQEYYKADSTVQQAVYDDVCVNWEMFEESKIARAKLNKKGTKRYDIIDKFLDELYKSTNQTDGELEQVHDDFCNAVNE